MYCLGVDIGGTTVKLGLFHVEGDLVKKWEIPTRTENEGVSVLPDVASSIATVLEQHNLSKEQVCGIGVGVPAPVTDGGIVKRTANLGWGYKNVKKELEDLTELPVKVGNDANVATLGEMWKGGGSGHKNLAMVTLGTGVGGGIIVEGQIIAGVNGAGGEIGHLCMNDNETDSCGCGKQGCLEQYASATGIARLAKKKLQETTEPTILTMDNPTAKDVFDAVKQGDKVADEIAKEFGEYLGRALANIATLVDPEIFVIGGGVSKAGPILLEYIKEPYQKYAFFATREVKFALAQLGNDAGICGAAKLILS